MRIPDGQGDHDEGKDRIRLKHPQKNPIESCQQFRATMHDSRVLDVQFDITFERPIASLKAIQIPEVQIW